MLKVIKLTIDMGAAVAAIGAGIAILGGAYGTGIAQAAIGSAGMGLVAEKPEQFGTALLLLVIPDCRKARAIWYSIAFTGNSRDIGDFWFRNCNIDTAWCWISIKVV